MTVVSGAIEKMVKRVTILECSKHSPVRIPPHAEADSVISDHSYDDKNIFIDLRRAMKDRGLDSKISY